jgi:hypothetical protein
MPQNLPQPVDDLGPLPRLHSERETRTRLRLGVNKWMRERAKLSHIQIGNRRYYTDAAIAAYLKRATVKPKRQAEERRAAP